MLVEFFNAMLLSAKLSFNLLDETLLSANLIPNGIPSHTFEAYTSLVIDDGSVTSTN